MWTISKVFVEFAKILLLLFMFWFFGHEAHEFLVLCPGIKSAPPMLEGKVLNTRPPGKSQKFLILSVSHSVVSDPLWSIDFSLLGSSVYGIFQARILEWVVVPFSRVSLIRSNLAIFFF